MKEIKIFFDGYFVYKPQLHNLSDETIEDLAIRELMKAEVEVNHTINGHIRIKNTNLEHNSLIALMLSDLTE